MSVAEQDATQTSAAERGTHGLFKYTSWVHVGDGAQECEQRFSGSCANEEHFHAWVRLPNPYEIRDLTEKASAAQARRRRMLRDPNSDASVILEDEMEELKSTDKRILVDELVQQGINEDYVEAVNEVDALEDPDWEPSEDDDEDTQPPKLFAHIDQDREEYARQHALPEEQRGEDYPELEKTMARYGDAIEAVMRKREEERRELFMEKPMDELVDMVRRERRERQVEEAFLHEFNTWQWYVCTFKPKEKGTPNERYWKAINQMKYETPPEVIAAVRATFADLEGRMGRSRAAGKS